MTIDVKEAELFCVLIVMRPFAKQAFDMKKWLGYSLLLEVAHTVYFSTASYVN